MSQDPQQDKPKTSKLAAVVVVGVLAGLFALAVDLFLSFADFELNSSVGRAARAVAIGVGAGVGIAIYRRTK